MEPVPLPTSPTPTLGQSGSLLPLARPEYETRRVVVASGTEFHDSDLAAKGYSRLQLFTWLQDKHPTLRLGGADVATFTSEPQRVHYEFQRVYTKHEFKEALQTPGLLVVYAGHARYGRGPCFAQYGGSVAEKGEHWEDGARPDGLLSRQDDGLFRMGYPFIPIPVSDIAKHGYTFAPVAAEQARPAQRDLHPHGKGRSIVRRALPSEIAPLVQNLYRSPSDRYYGVMRRNHGTQEFHPFLRAGWLSTQNAPYDIGATSLRCRCFCHFGCSTKPHAWRIVRKRPYKHWRRPSPPTDRYAYFTDRTATPHCWLYWLQHLLGYDQPSAHEPWWEALEYAKRRANRDLLTDADVRGWNMRYQIY